MTGLSATVTSLSWSSEPEPEPPTLLEAGPVAVELEGIDLRLGTLHGFEFLRRLYVAVRDETWGTVLPVVTLLEVDRRPDSFEVRVGATHRRDEVWFDWEGSIVGTSAGHLSYEMDGICRSAFAFNRIGLCLLHPAAAAGAEVTARAGDAELITSLPTTIGPQRIVDGTILGLFPDFNELRLDDPRLSVSVVFEGDQFEMEDQRNWTDASFKTYSTPLSRPLPQRASSGMTITQRVAISASARAARRRSPVGGERVELTLGWNLARGLPQLGTIIDPSMAIGPHEIALLQALELAHVRIDLRLESNDWRSRLEWAQGLARQLGARLELAVFCDEETLRGSGKEIPTGVDVARVLVLPVEGLLTSPSLLEAARGHLGTGAPIVGGTDDSFVELNRTQPLPVRGDAICFSINPQVHAFDDTTLIENIEAQADVVESARQLSSGLPVVVSPVTLLPRRGGGDDPRVATSLGAAWTLASLKQLAEAGAVSVTYFSALGLVVPQGAAPAPVYDLLRSINQVVGGEVVASSSSAPLRVQSLALKAGSSIHLFTANLSPRAERCTLHEAGLELELRPHELAVVELSSDDLKESPDLYDGVPNGG
jgi:hypothetical protein